ncbi:MAG TPA: metallophosphoesterase, partial [Vicinamibacteria bacterium]
MSFRHEWNRADFMFLAVVTVVAALIVVGRHAPPAEPSSSVKAGKHKKKKGPEAPAFARDWARFPPVAIRATGEEVVALGDVHGGYERLVSLLSVGGLLRAQPGGPEKQGWAGGKRMLVCTGDLINKGSQSIESVELMMSLQKQAPAAGGEVIVTFGNHEAEFLAKPDKKKAAEFRDELEARGIDPMEVVRGEDDYGEWLLNLPVAAKVNGWFFSHAGNSGGKTLDQIATSFRSVEDRGDWRAPFMIGDDSLL